jgi:hypothetical protein
MLAAPISNTSTLSDASSAMPDFRRLFLAGLKG